MRKIVLLCAAGMSTSLLVSKMKQAAAEEGYETDIAAYPVATAKDHKDADIILLGPQVRFAKKQVQGEVGDGVIVQDIEMQAYGTMNGKKVIAQVKKALGD
jgi:PTS system cellobiose-specific IIB component